MIETQDNANESFKILIVLTQMFFASTLEFEYSTWTLSVESLLKIVNA